MELVLLQKPSALLCHPSCWTLRLLPTPALPLAIKARAAGLTGAGCWEASLGFAPAQAAGKESTANKTPLSKLPACHIQAISLLCVFFSFLIS